MGDSDSDWGFDMANPGGRKIYLTNFKSGACHAYDFKTLRKMLSDTSKPALSQKSPLSRMLSQYGLLKSIAGYITTSDLCNLAMSCKIYWHYIAKKTSVLKLLQEQGLCSGKGQDLRAQVFNYKDGSSNSSIHCEPEDTQPCDSCGIGICNVCRYHILYPGQALYKPVNQPDYDTQETQEDYEIDSFHASVEHFFAHELDKDEVKFDLPLEARKITGISGDRRQLRYCKDCCPTQGTTAEELYSCIGPEHVCDCSMSRQWFASWLCIPCVLAMETEALQPRISRRKISYKKNDDASSEFPLIRVDDGIEYLCDCGKPAMLDHYIECRWCDKIIRPAGFDFAKYKHISESTKMEMWCDINGVEY